MKFIKKNINKILIALSLCLTITFTIFGISKTYAYTYDSNTDTIISDNLFDKNTYTYINGASLNDNGEVIANSISWKTITYYMPIEENTTYTLSGTQIAQSNWSTRIAFYDENHEQISQIKSSQIITSVTFTTPFNARYWRYSWAIVTNNSDWMLNIGNIAKPYEPYGSYINENKYNNLENNYNDLENNYNDLEDNYNELQDNYNELQDNYNNVNRDLNDYRNFVKYGTLTYTKNFNFYTGNQDIYYTLGELYNTNYYTYNNIKITEWFKDNEEEADEHRGFIITFNDNVVYLNNINLAFITSDELSPTTCAISIYDNGTIRNFIIPFNENINVFGVNGEGYDLTSKNLIEYFKNNNITFTENTYIRYISLSDFPIREDINYDYELIIFPYDTDSYNIGFNEATTIAQSKISRLENENTNLKTTIEQQNENINNLSEQINTLNTQYNNLNQQYNDLIERYNNLNSGNNDLYHMIIAVADTPITIFKQIFNFDVLGINISGIVTAIISLLVIIWLIKKLI